ncbi:MAG: PAS domain S-box protein [Deltaproteobacteria bacterium]|nr:PAS domain S-box protein [Deltaproteobacteria bacterium]
MADPPTGPDKGGPEDSSHGGAHQSLLDRLAELKTSQAELAEATARVRATLDAAIDGIVTIDASGTIEAANTAALALFGYTAEELVGENVKRLMPPPYRDEHDGYLKAYRETGEKRIIGIGREVVGVRKDGTTFPMEVSVGEADAGDRKIFAGVIRDITERKETERELRDSLSQMSSVLETAVDGIISISDHGIVESFNRAAERIFGYRAQETISKNVRMLMPPSYADEHDGYLRTFLRTGKKNIIGVGREVTGLRKDGTTFPMDLSVSEAFGNSRRTFTGTVRDLTERREAEQAQASLASILEDSLNEIFVFDADTLRFIQVNRGARENLGYSMGELRGLTPLDIKPELTAEEFQELVEPLRSGAKERIHFETTHRRRDDSLYPVDVHLQLVRYAGKPAFVALIFDMTEQRHALEALARTEKRAQEAEKLASIATLTSGIAHDVGAPMSVILGYARLIEKSAEDEKQRKRARLIAEQIQRITELIQTLLNISRPHEPNRVPLQIPSVLEHSLQFLQEKLRKREISVECEFSEVPEISGDRDHLEQVFLNLFVNAADAMPSGGSLQVDVQSPENGWVEVRVRDTGNGIPPDALEKIFEPFFTTKERGKGNGLGLLVSKSIVVEHGGTIEASSELGEGTEFRIRLPCAPTALAGC